MQDGNFTSGITLSLWLKDNEPLNFPALANSMQVDICIIGAGIAGLSAAYHLVKAGKSVVVLEDGNVISGETGRTTAHLANGLDDRYCVIERIHGEE